MYVALHSYLKIKKFWLKRIAVCLTVVDSIVGKTAIGLMKQNGFKKFQMQLNGWNIIN